MTRAHYWRQIEPKSPPNNHLVWDCETVPYVDPKYPTVERHTLRLGWAFAWRMEHGKQTRRAECLFRSADRFWDFLRSRLDANRPLFCWAHNVAFDLGAVSGWEVLSDGSWKWKSVAIDSGVFFLKGTHNERPVVIADSLNFWRTSLKSLGESVGLAKGRMPTYGEDEDRWSDYCYRDTEILERGIVSLCGFCSRIGSWGSAPTGSSLAWSAYRSQPMLDRVVAGYSGERSKFERRSYHGGRVNVNCDGICPFTPVYELDVVSMYPSVCLGDLPTRPFRHVTRAGHLDLAGVLSRWHAIADVTIKTKTETFPAMHNGRLYYPVGEYRTTLADAELRVAHEFGCIRAVHELVAYHRAPIFRDYMERFFALKDEFTRSGDESYRTLTKLMLNGLYGKTGQRSSQWCTLGKESWQRLEQFLGLDHESLSVYYELDVDLANAVSGLHVPDLGGEIPLRYLFGTVEMRTGYVESRDSVPSIASCVTSAARAKLRTYQRDAGGREWVYGDTDSIFVSGQGLESLVTAGHVRDGELGYLQQKRVHSRMVVHGAKDYETDSYTKIKGVRRPDQPNPDGSFTQPQFPGAKSQLRDGVSGEIHVRNITKRMYRRKDRYIVGPDSWTIPLEFPLTMSGSDLG